MIETKILELYPRSNILKNGKSLGYEKYEL